MMELAPSRKVQDETDSGSLPFTTLRKENARTSSRISSQEETAEFELPLLLLVSDECSGNSSSSINWPQAEVPKKRTKKPFKRKFKWTVRKVLKPLGRKIPSSKTKNRKLENSWRSTGDCSDKVG